MGPSPRPRQYLPFTFSEMAASQECSRPTAVTATCPLLGHCPPLTACLTATAKDSNSKRVCPSKWWVPARATQGHSESFQGHLSLLDVVTGTS